MTKTEIAKKIIEQNGKCTGIECTGCFLNDNEGICFFKNPNELEKVELSKKYLTEIKNEKNNL